MGVRPSFFYRHCPALRPRGSSASAVLNEGNSAERNADASLCTGGARCLRLRIVGLLERRDKTVLRMGHDSLAALLLFAAGLMLARWGRLRRRAAYADRHIACALATMASTIPFASSSIRCMSVCGVGSGGRPESVARSVASKSSAPLTRPAIAIHRAALGPRKRSVRRAFKLHT